MKLSDLFESSVDPSHGDIVVAAMAEFEEVSNLLKKARSEGNTKEVEYLEQVLASIEQDLEELDAAITESVVNKLTTDDAYYLTNAAQGKYEMWTIPKDTIERLTQLLATHWKQPYSVAKSTRDTDSDPENWAIEWFQQMINKSPNYLVDYWIPANTTKKEG